MTIPIPLLPLRIKRVLLQLWCILQSLASIRKLQLRLGHHHDCYSIVL